MSVPRVDVRDERLQHARRVGRIDEPEEQSSGVGGLRIAGDLPRNRVEIFSLPGLPDTSGQLGISRGVVGLAQRAAARATRLAPAW